MSSVALKRTAKTTLQLCETYQEACRYKLRIKQLPSERGNDAQQIYSVCVCLCIYVELYRYTPALDIRRDGRCHERQRCESTSLSDASFHIHHAMCHNKVGSRKGGGEGGMGRKQDKKRSRRGTVGDGRAAGRSGQNSRSRCSNWVHLSSICLTRRKTRAIAFLAAAATVTRTQQQFAPECRARTVREGGKRK